MSLAKGMRMNVRDINKGVFLLILLSLGNSAFAASAGSGGVGTAFSKNSTSVSIVLGSGSAFGDSYYVLGGGVGYYVLEGLELGVDLQYWFSGDPSIAKISPHVRYVFTQPEHINPYIGAFYTRSFIDSDFLDDQDSYGYRGGAYFTPDNRVYIGGGFATEEYKDCPKQLDCSNTYPELLFQVSF